MVRPIIRSIVRNVPPRNALWQVFSLVVFVVFSWVVFRMLYQVPSWLISHSKAGLLVLGAYTLGFALVESCVVFGAMLLLALLLPGKFLRDHFVVQGTLLLAGLTIWALSLQRIKTQLVELELEQLIGLLAVLLVGLTAIMVITTLLDRRFSKFSQAVERFTEKMILFSWIYVPAGLVGLFIVVVRNL